MASKGIEEMNKAFAAASGQRKPNNEGIADPADVMGALKETLGTMANSYSATQMARVVKEIIRPDEEKSDPLSSLKSLKEAGLLDSSREESAANMRGVTDLMTTMLMERGKEATEAREEAREATNNLLALAVQTMNSGQQQAFQQLADKLEEQRQPSPFQGAVEEAMAKILMRSLGDVVEPKPQQQSGSNFIGQLQQMDQTLDFLTNWLKKREQQLGGSNVQEVRNPYMNPEILRATLEDERERLRLRQEEKKWEEELRSKDRAMSTAEAIAKELGPTLMAFLNRGGGGRLSPEAAAEAMKMAQEDVTEDEGDSIEI